MFVRHPAGISGLIEQYFSRQQPALRDQLPHGCVMPTRTGTHNNEAGKTGDNEGNGVCKTSFMHFG